MKMSGVFTVLRNVLLAAILFIFSGNAFAWDHVGVGMTITFGSYPQTESGHINPIEWRVLEVKDGKAFLLADKGLDVLPYNSTGKKATWKISSMRQWLNTNFYNAAFNDSEKSRISITVLNIPDKVMYGTDGGGDTRDRIFLLTAHEVDWYLGYAERILKPTPYAVKKGALSDKTSWWLLSPVSSSDDNMFHCSTSYVDFSGLLPPGLL